MAKKMLVGAAEITKFLGITESTFMDAVVNRGLPAEKNDDAVYTISEDDALLWEGKSLDEIPAADEEKPAKATKGKKATAKTGTK